MIRVFLASGIDHGNSECHILYKFWSKSVHVTTFFSPLGKVAGRAIYFTDVFSLFFIFLEVAPGATLAQKPMDRSSPKFQDW